MWHRESARSVRVFSIRPKYDCVSFESTLANEFSFVDFCKQTSS